MKPKFLKLQRIEHPIGAGHLIQFGLGFGFAVGYCPLRLCSNAPPTDIRHYFYAQATENYWFIRVFALFFGRQFKG